MPLTTLTSAAEVLLASDHDPYVRSTLRQPMVSGWAGHGAVAWRATDAEERVPYVMTWGQPAQVALLIEELLPELRDQTRVTLPRGTAPLLPAWVALDGTDWDFRWLGEPPPVQPGEDAVVEVRGEQAGPLLALASPTASALPGDPAVRRWLGVRGLDGLSACAADTSGATGVGHLSSIAVHPDARGRGLGAAVSAALTRRLFAEGCDVVTLGMYATNTAGRALYDHLGMKDEHRFTSGPLQIRSRW
ncbi:MAG: gcn5-related n-acetyltransferase [Frankiales bacterium]|nr:gcn5-related n-acetyltransferase [Frankiales bacterium]